MCRLKVVALATTNSKIAHYTPEGVWDEVSHISRKFCRKLPLFWEGVRGGPKRDTAYLDQ